jgi:hypothetical protein
MVTKNSTKPQGAVTPVLFGSTYSPIKGPLGLDASVILVDKPGIAGLEEEESGDRDVAAGNGESTLVAAETKS